MANETNEKHLDELWCICNLIPGPYKRNGYRKVIKHAEGVRSPIAVKTFLETDREALLFQIRSTGSNSDFGEMIEEMMVGRLAKNDKFITRYMVDSDFQTNGMPIISAFNS